MVFESVFVKFDKKGIVEKCLTSQSKDSMTEFIRKDQLLKRVHELKRCYVDCGYGEKGFYLLLNELEK